MLHIPRNIIIKCNNCKHEIIIDAYDIDYETLEYERPMGTEIEYNFKGEVYCEKCNKCISFSIRGYEYPVGAFNYSDFECYGGIFMESPVVEINYEFDECYYDEVYESYENLEDILEYERNKIKNMSPRGFEIFVAELFTKLGYSVKIISITKDGGKDIIATKSDPIPYTLIIECKHWGDNHKVDVSVVRSVYGVQIAEQANQSVIVTSSKFTKDARKFASERKDLMRLIDIDDLLNLIYR